VRANIAANASAVAVGGAGRRNARKPPRVQTGERRLVLGQEGWQAKLKDRDLVFILRNSLNAPRKAVFAARKHLQRWLLKSVGRHSEMLHAIRRHLESGETFSSALARYGGAFDP